MNYFAILVSPKVDKKFKVHYNLRLNLILLCDVDHNMMHKCKKHNCMYLAALSNCEQGDPKKCPMTMLLQKLPRKPNINASGCFYDHFFRSYLAKGGVPIIKIEI